MSPGFISVSGRTIGASNNALASYSERSLEISKKFNSLSVVPTYISPEIGFYHINNCYNCQFLTFSMLAITIFELRIQKNKIQLTLYFKTIKNYIISLLKGPNIVYFFIVVFLHYSFIVFNFSFEFIFVIFIFIMRALK